MKPGHRPSIDAAVERPCRQPLGGCDACRSTGTWAACALALVLAGCAAPGNAPMGSVGAPTSASAPGAGAHATPGAVPAPGPTTHAALVTEQQWLEQWFKGTPVAIGLHTNVLEVSVPQGHSFEVGSLAPKPALAAVLDRVAESLRRQVGTRVSVTAAADAGGVTALAVTRAARVREYLVGRSVATTRVSIVPAAGAGTGVQLRISVVPQPITRLDDGTLPVPASGVRPVSGTRPAASSGDGKVR